MKKLILMAGCAALAACSGAKEDAAPEGDAAATTAEAPAEDSMAGTYEATAADGTVITTTIDAEGNYVDTVDGKQTGSGTVAVAKNGQTCFNSSEAGAAPECWTDGEKAEDGSWTATNDDGESVTVRKVEPAA
ncbi:MAG: hypothetical protein H6920_04205 [Sphingomonadaceae bacterium]|jgi:hypothetical protein|nr:hypothetical protein [Sphingomonadaceae bacterium]MCB2086573.1 hypothetical protein [Sphingomonadaceae bacterium]MCP5383902.1 hypothetical protein [Altererythrobacter sp.]MCP5390815.1 hypothetical protein [Sphingomonadaceae bacterium]MCP5394211.1 hypothetical protein [Sphingomonadaceae bacterium]